MIDLRKKSDSIKEIKYISDKMKVLVIAPHPDDEVLGCGGTIKKYASSGNDVYLCVVTKPYMPDWTEQYIKEKQEHIAKSNKILGIKETFFLDLPTVKLDTIEQKKLNDLISSCVERVKPEVLFIPFKGDINKDHQLVSEASLVAARPKPGSSIKKVLAYEVLSETEWGMANANSIEKVFLPNYYEDIEKYMEDKKKAMASYESEVKEYPHPRSLEGLEILAKKRGMEVGLKYAEAFMVLREIVN